MGINGKTGERIEPMEVGSAQVNGSHGTSPEPEVINEEVVNDDESTLLKEDTTANEDANRLEMALNHSLNGLSLTQPKMKVSNTPVDIPPLLTSCPSPEAEKCLDDAVRGHLVRQSLVCFPTFFSESACGRVEACIEGTAQLAAQKFFRCPRTVDKTPYRTKYFFGYGYTYGKGREEGVNELLPEGSVDPIPTWILHTVVAPLVARGVIPHGFINSVVINDYFTGGSIVAHIDPPTLFERPIVTVSFFGDASLVFGASFDPLRKTPPVHSQYLPRGSVLILQGYSADGITHGIRPEDICSDRRTSIVLRRVRTDAPIIGTAALKKDVASCTELIRSLQGWWRDEWGSSRYFVQGMDVDVFEPGGKIPKQSWRIMFAEDGNGLICGRGTLSPETFDPQRIEWEPLWGKFGFTWLPLED